LKPHAGRALIFIAKSGKKRERGEKEREFRPHPLATADQERKWRRGSLKATPHSLVNGESEEFYSKSFTSRPRGENRYRMGSSQGKWEAAKRLPSR